jgi:hypothetical protein
MWLLLSAHHPVESAQALGAPVFTSKEIAEWGSALLVFASGGMAGHYASIGMSPVQWAGAAAAVLGSVTVAVAIRVWPAPVKAKSEAQD